MVTRLDPKYLMGRVRDFNNYDRFNLPTKTNPHHSAILKFDCGVFFAFKCNTKTLKISYKPHFGKVNFIISKKLQAEMICMGKCKNEWRVLNIPHQFLKYEDFEKDQEIRLDIHLKGIHYDEFQVCLPACGRVNDVFIETDEEIQFIKKPNNVIFLGSSVAQDCNVASHTNYCCMAYRKYGINIATLAISSYNSLLCPELMKYLTLPFFKNKTIVLMDNIHTTVKDFENMKKILPNTKICMVGNDTRDEVKELLKSHPEISNDIIRLDGNCRNDDVHLNPIGSELYLNKLREKNII